MGKSELLYCGVAVRSAVVLAVILMVDGTLSTGIMHVGETYVQMWIQILWTPMESLLVVEIVELSDIRLLSVFQAQDISEMVVRKDEDFCSPKI